MRFFFKHTSFSLVINFKVRAGVRHIVVIFWNMFQVQKIVSFFFLGLKHVIDTCVCFLLLVQC